MPNNSSERNQASFNRQITSFDRLGLPLQQRSSLPATTKEQVAFQMLQLKCLLESAFELEGFNQATASNHAMAYVVVEYEPAEKLYRSFHA